jgi:hypothetical protein
MPGYASMAKVADIGFLGQRLWEWFGSVQLAEGFIDDAILYNRR